MKQLSYLFILLAVIMLSCKSSADSVNGSDGSSNDDTDTEIRQDDLLNGNSEGTEATQSDGKHYKMEGDDLVGQWVWVKTSCCGRLTSDTFPEEGAAPRIISFDKEGMAEYYSGDKGQKLMRQPYTIGELGTQTTVKIGDLQPAIIMVHEQELSLSWGYIDLQIEYYQRVKE